MRTTLDLDDHLLNAARKTAAQSGLTLTAFVEHALAASLAPAAAPARRFRLKWKPHHGRTLSGVDISDRDALYERMQGRD